MCPVFSSVTILKDRFYYDSGRARPTDQEMTAIKESLLCSGTPRSGSTPLHGGQVGKHQGGSGGRGREITRAKAFVVLYCGFQGKERGRQEHQIWNWLFE